MSDTLFGQQSPTSDAGFSACERYRYWLTRTWDASKPVVCWLMLNPSTADASVNDPTIRRCIDFAKRWGAGGIAVVNLFALRATDPKELQYVQYPIASPDEPHCFQENMNDAWIINKSDGRRVIAAWGCHGTYKGRDRQVMKLLASRRVECLGVTKDGHPKHPLYVAATTVPMPLPAAPGPREKNGDER